LSMFFNHSAPSLLYTLSLHDALPILNYAIKTLSDKYLGYNAKIYYFKQIHHLVLLYPYLTTLLEDKVIASHSAPNWIIKNIAKEDRKSTRLNSSHVKISYAVFCLKKK